MKKGIVIFVIGVVCTFSFASSASATLMDRGGGMIYDDDRDITWLQDANYGAGSAAYDDGSSSTDGRMTWSSANAWADSLVFGGSDDWRLPTVVDTGSSGCDFGYSGTDCGYNVDTATGEMAHLYYDELGNLALHDTSGSAPQPGWGLSNTGAFTNLQSSVYWSGTEYALGSGNAWYFNFNGGLQSAGGKGNNMYALAVRSGDVSAVPEPGMLLVFGVGLAGLIVYRKKSGQIDRGDLII